MIGGGENYWQPELRRGELEKEEGLARPDACALYKEARLVLVVIGMVAADIGRRGSWRQRRVCLKGRVAARGGFRSTPEVKAVPLVGGG